MKKTFSREYWFLVSCWAVFTLLGLAAGALGGMSPDSGALWRFKDPVMAYTGVQTAAAVLLSAANALSGAAAGMIAIRYWVKPYLLLWLLMLVWDAGTVWPALKVRGSEPTPPQPAEVKEFLGPNEGSQQGGRSRHAVAWQVRPTPLWALALPKIGGCLLPLTLSEAEA